MLLLISGQLLELVVHTVWHNAKVLRAAGITLLTIVL